MFLLCILIRSLVCAFDLHRLLRIDTPWNGDTEVLELSNILLHLFIFRPECEPFLCVCRDRGRLFTFQRTQSEKDRRLVRVGSGPAESRTCRQVLAQPLLNAGRTAGSAQALAYRLVQAF